MILGEGQHGKRSLLAMRFDAANLLKRRSSPVQLHGGVDEG